MTEGLSVSINFHLIIYEAYILVWFRFLPFGKNGIQWIIQGSSASSAQNRRFDGTDQAVYLLRELRLQILATLSPISIGRTEVLRHRLLSTVPRLQPG